MPGTFGCTATAEFSRNMEFLVDLGWGAGLGIRQDLEFFILRLDAAIRLHDPTQPEGERWVGTPKLSALHLGLGLPVLIRGQRAAISHLHANNGEELA